MSVEAFLKLDAITGDSTDVAHPGEIVIETFAFALSNSAGGRRGGGGGRASFQDCSFTALTSRASPQLFLKCAQGALIRQGVLSVRRPGEDPQDFYKVTLTDIIVTSFEEAADVDAEADRPLDAFSLNYGVIVIEYRVQNPDGSLGTAVTAGWDLRAGRPA